MFKERLKTFRIEEIIDMKKCNNGLDHSVLTCAKDLPLFGRETYSAGSLFPINFATDHC